MTEKITNSRAAQNRVWRHWPTILIWISLYLLSPAIKTLKIFKCIKLCKLYILLPNKFGFNIAPTFQLICTFFILQKVFWYLQKRTNLSFSFIFLKRYPSEKEMYSLNVFLHTGNAQDKCMCILSCAKL